MRLSLVYIEKKVTNKMELDAPFGLIYFRGLPDANLHLTYQLFLPDSKFVFSSIISKNRFRFLPNNLCFDSAEERQNSGRPITFSL